MLTADGALQARIADPRHKLAKTYWVEVEGQPRPRRSTVSRRASTSATSRPRRPGAPIPPPARLWPRDPPVRFRQAIPTAWLEIVLTEGRNRQVRRMTAAVGLPTLRLIRWSIGPWTLAGLRSGEWRRCGGWRDSWCAGRSAPN